MADPAETLRRLMAERYPVYAEADLTIESREVPHGIIVDEILTGLRDHLVRRRDAASAPETGS